MPRLRLGMLSGRGSAAPGICVRRAWKLDEVL